MNEEFDALLKNGTWSLVSLSPNMTIVGCKWVFKIKRKANVTIERYKARLVAKGFHQQPGIDFAETYSPLVKHITIRTVLALAVSAGWAIHQVDVSNAFLNGLLQETVYMAQPPGFQHPFYPTAVCKLHKVLYGLKQAPRAWVSRLNAKLLELKFQSSKADSSLFTYKAKGIIIFVLIYVDDIIITSSNTTAISQLISALHSSFALKDLGPLHYFLGVEATWYEDGLHLSQQSYITSWELKLLGMRMVYIFLNSATFMIFSPRQICFLSSLSLLQCPPLQLLVDLMVRQLQILLYTAAQLALFSIYLLLDLILLLRSTKSHSSCKIPGILTGL
jgi:hypothetical protein